MTAASWLFALALPAQEPQSSELLQIGKLTPQSPGKLATGDKLTVEIRCTNPQKDPVLVFASALSKGRMTQNATTGGAYPTPQGETTVARWISFKSPATVDEIKITMVDAADQRKSIAMIRIPVQLAWEGETIPPSKPKPAPASRKALRLTLVGYEVSQDVASSLFRLPSAEFVPEKLLAALTPLSAKGAARAVKLPVLDVPAGADRGKSLPVSGHTLEAVLERGNGDYVRAVYSLSAGTHSSATNWVLMRLGQPAFMGSMAGSSGDKLVLTFARISEN